MKRPSRGRRRWCAAALWLCLAGCATLPRPDYGAGLTPTLPARVEWADVAFFPQDEYQCGPAALATVLDRAGVKRQPQQLVDEVYVPQRQGSLQPEMLGATRRAGLLPYRLEAQPNALLREVAAGHPVVVLQNLRFDVWPQWHYAVVVGYDLDAGVVVLRSGTEKRLLMPISEFDRSWAKAERWAFVALPPERLPATAREADYVAAAANLERVSPAPARRAYQTALAAWPRNLFARMALGNAAYRQGQLGQAEAAYRQATLDHPQAADAWNNLAQVLHETKRLAQAREAAQRAVALGGPRLAIYEATLRSIEAAALR
ncbi:PA2778 family cysteine peptidase [Ramlibacter sp. 2FC]|uniref:PA2778 family cysteine peptidase n=1 Tax=Ramlibacter sp. 2FC TaxID=2502188 RepID=UPI0010F8ADE8|nr:PA2778 family cysteine peptidase [Ramlibacter sp. 2FC]